MRTATTTPKARPRAVADAKIVARMARTASAAAGAGVGAAVIVTNDSESGPAALAIDGTDVGVAWSACNEGSDGAGCGIRFRRYDGDLAPVGEAQPVNSTTPGDQEDPSIGWLPDRSVAVTWSDGSATDPDRDQSAVRARIIYPAAP